MDSILQLLGSSALVFAAAVGMGYFYRRNRSWSSPHFESIAPNTPVRMKTTQAMYRSRYLRSEKGWLYFSAPLSRDSNAPLRVGEPVTVEAATDRGVMLVRSRIADHAASRGELALHAPEFSSLVDRRDGGRATYDPHLAIEVDGLPAELVDATDRGMRFWTATPFAKGDRIGVDLPWRSDRVGAWVIDCHCLATGPDRMFECRAIFEEPANPPLP